MKKKPFFNLVTFFLMISLLNHCSPVKKKNIIGIHYKKTNQYNETEIFQDLSKIAFKYNYQIIREGYEREPVYRVIKRFCRQGARIIILEDYSSDDLSKIIKYARKNEVLLSLITDKKIHDAPIVNLTEFKQLGYKIINDLYIFYSIFLLPDKFHKVLHHHVSDWNQLRAQQFYRKTKGCYHH